MLGLLLALAAPAPQAIRNSRLEVRALDRPLAAAVAAASPSEQAAWVGWIAAYHGRGRVCCVEWDERRRPGVGCCRLESSRGFNVGDDGRGGSAPRSLLVLVRVLRGAADRIRAYSDDCEIDAEGRRVVWLEGVPPAEGVAYLHGLASSGAGAGDLGQDALSALAFHAAPQAVEALIALARHDASAESRSEALFWLAQRAGEEARAAITRAIEEDPETEVKRRAVFALSELPPDEGVPLLIDLARRHKNPVVREQAFFWLGESEDPRALAFFEEVLLR
jgi:HEAT repeat protein